MSYYTEQTLGPTNVTILGSGVIGLTIAYLLVTEEENTSSGMEITIVARDIPGDTKTPSKEWASPWAVSTTP